MKYRKKPVIVEAVQYDGTFPLSFLKDDERVWADAEGTKLCIRTLEGIMECNLHDWIIRGVEGELYPCKPSVFEKTYEPYPVTGA